MKQHSLSILLLFVIVVLFVTPGCDQTQTTEPDDSKTANEKSEQAYAEMENLFAASGSIEDKDFSNVEKLYKEAVAADPTNPTANFGAAFAHLLGMMSDTSIRNTINRWEDSPANTPSSFFKFGIPAGTGDMTLPTRQLGTNLVKIIETAMSSPPTIAEMQNLMRDKILPRITYAIARMAVVENNPSFELRISGKMQGSAGKKDLYLDLTEVYIMDAMLQGMRASVEQFLVFRFDLSSYDTKALVEALQQNNSTFFVLAADGSTRAQNVRSSLVAAVTKLKSGANFLKGETDDQDNDIIKKGSDGISTSDIDTLLSYLGKLETALTGTFTVELKDADTDHNDYTVSINLSNFFSNLPQNPKSAWFPPYTVDSTSRGDLAFHWQAQDYASFNFPDPTFGGLFPGMTNETLKRILHIDEEFSWEVDVSVLENFNNASNTTLSLTINGTTYSPRKENDWNSGTFYITSHDGMPVQSLNITKDGLPVSIEFVGKTPVVHLKSYSFIAVDITRSPQNITASYNSSQNSISVNLQTFAYYYIERSVNSGAFSRIDSSYTSFYMDNTVSAGTTYHYRAIRGINLYSHDYFAQRTNNYTNTASVTIP